MKKMIILLSFILTLSLSACGISNFQEENIEGISSETSAEITDDSEEIQSEGDAYDGTYTDAEFSEEAPEQEKVYQF